MPFVNRLVHGMGLEEDTFRRDLRFSPARDQPRLRLYPVDPVSDIRKFIVAFVLFPREPLAIGTFRDGGRRTLLGENEGTDKGSHARSTPRNN